MRPIPSALRYVPYNALFVASPTIAATPYFYALSGVPSATTNQLSIFQLSTINWTAAFGIPADSHHRQRGAGARIFQSNAFQFDARHRLYHVRLESAQPEYDHAST